MLIELLALIYLLGSRSLIDALGGEGEEMDLGGRSIKVRQYASWFNFKGADQQKQVKNLSGDFMRRGQHMLHAVISNCKISVGCWF